MSHSIMLKVRSVWENRGHLAARQTLPDLGNNSENKLYDPSLFDNISISVTNAFDFVLFPNYLMQK